MCPDSDLQAFLVLTFRIELSVDVVALPFSVGCSRKIRANRAKAFGLIPKRPLADLRSCQVFSLALLLTVRMKERPRAFTKASIKRTLLPKHVVFKNDPCP